MLHQRAGLALAPADVEQMVAYAQDARFNSGANNQITGCQVEVGILRRQLGKCGTQSGGEALGCEEDLGGKAMARKEWGDLFWMYAVGAGKAAWHAIPEDATLQEGRHECRIAQVATF